MQETLFVFDIDGTLLDSVRCHQAAFHKAVRECGFTEINSDWGSYKHHTDSWIFSELYRVNHGHWPAEKTLREFESRLLEYFQTEITGGTIREIEGASRFLRELDDNGISYVFATGAMAAVTAVKLEFLDVESAKVPLATASDHFEREQIVLKATRLAEERFGRTYQRWISVGDGLWDALTAQNLGFEFIGIQESAETFKGHCEPNRIFRNFTELSTSNITVLWAADRSGAREPQSRRPSSESVGRSRECQRIR